MIILTDEEWDKCLNTDPFEGNFKDGEITLSDKKVKAAKKHENKCYVCLGSIEKGEVHRALTEVCDGSVVTTRFCSECCYAMAASWEDAGELWTARVALNDPNKPLLLTEERRIISPDLNAQVRPEVILTDDILRELVRARTKFPGKNVTFAAMIEEVGELATALFEENKDRVRAEAIQVAVMAMRVVLDGDHTFDSWRSEKGLDQL